MALKKSKKEKVVCVDGPWKGGVLYLDVGCGLTTGVLSIKGQIGFYSKGRWNKVLAQ